MEGRRQLRYRPQYNEEGFYFRAVLQGVSPETRVTRDRSDKSKYARSTRVEVCGMKPLSIPYTRSDVAISCSVSCSVSTSRHFMYLRDLGSRKIQRIEACMEAAKRRLRVDMNPEKGALVIARLPGTDKYARCIVLENNIPIAIRIFFVDYGPTVSVDPDQVFCLEDPELRTIAPQAFLVDADIEDRKMAENDHMIFKRYPTVAIVIVGVSEDKCAFKVRMKILCENYEYKSISELLKGSVEMAVCSQAVGRKLLRDSSNSSNLTVCCNCDRRGHLHAECPLSMCYNCKESGRMSRGCPSVVRSNATHLGTDSVGSRAQEVEANRTCLSNSFRLTRNETFTVPKGSFEGIFPRVPNATIASGGVLQIRSPKTSKNQVNRFGERNKGNTTSLRAAKIQQWERPSNTRGTDDNLKSEGYVGFVFNMTTEADAVRICIKSLVNRKAAREELQKVDPELLKELQQYVKIWRAESNK